MELVKQYYQENHVKSEYKVGDRISYAARVYDEEELLNFVDSSLEFWLTSGRYCDEFEHKLAEYFKNKNSSFIGQFRIFCKFGGFYDTYSA